MSDLVEPLTLGPRHGVFVLPYLDWVFLAFHKAHELLVPFSAFSAKGTKQLRLGASILRTVYETTTPTMRRGQGSGFGVHIRLP